MKTPTLNEILQLRNFVLEKTERVEHLERMIIKAQESYKGMTRAQLEEAVRDVAGMRREIEQHKKWCEDAKKRINAFFACPVMVA